MIELIILMLIVMQQFLVRLISYSLTFKCRGSTQGIIQKKSASCSWMLPCLMGCFSKSYFDLKMPKIFFKQGYLSNSNHYLPKKCPFTVLGAVFLFFECFPVILDYCLPLQLYLFIFVCIAEFCISLIWIDHNHLNQPYCELGD